MGQLSVLKKENEHLRKMLDVSRETTAKGRASKTLLVQLKQAESRYATLLARWSMLEEEYQAYQDHMRNLVSKYQEEIRILKQRSNRSKLNHTTQSTISSVSNS